ncbi:MAG: EamA family transporter [Candidatus Puniceispirillaceae bacterium]
MELWIWITLVAATTQTLRSAGQKQMKSVMGDFGASYIRFSYALPFAAIWLYAVMTATGQPVPQTNFDFWLWVSIGGLMQVIFTVLLITLFNHRNFAAGTAFSKTEVLQAAIFEAVIIGEFVSFQVGVAIAIGVFAIVMLSFHKSQIGKDGLGSIIGSHQTLLGLAAGAFLGLSTVSFRAATDALATGDVLIRASMSAVTSTLLQTIVMGAALLVVARGELIDSFRHWRKAWPVGLFGAITTACWFTAFSLQNVASVRAIGQVELLITLGISALFFKEKISRIEFLAVVLLGLSILLVLLDG